MKELLIKIDDELSIAPRERLIDLEAEVNQRVTEYLESVNGDDDNIVAARIRLTEMFHQTTNFGVGVRPTREQMHGR